jgi:hypothetical protein
VFTNHNPNILGVLYIRDTTDRLDHNIFANHKYIFLVLGQAQDYIFTEPQISGAIDDSLNHVSVDPQISGAADRISVEPQTSGAADNFSDRTSYRALNIRSCR